jgi:hypothetical protein
LPTVVPYERRRHLMTMDPRDNTSHNTSSDTSDTPNATPHDADDLLPTDEPDVDHVPDVDERYIPVGMQAYDIICLTPESAVGGLLVDSPAGSGPRIYPDFSTAVRDAWGELEGDYSVDGQTPLLGEAVPPELREARRAFTALLDHFEEDGFSSDLAEELDDLCCQYTPYRVVQISYVLPAGLQSLLDMAYGEEDAEDAEDAEDEEALASAPPRDKFDLHDSKHMEWLEKQLEYLQYA